MDFDYEKYTDNELKQAGFNTDKLTQEQKDVITEPTEAPENYYCDGEITIIIFKCSITFSCFYM